MAIAEAVRNIGETIKERLPDNVVAAARSFVDGAGTIFDSAANNIRDFASRGTESGLSAETLPSSGVDVFNDFRGFDFRGLKEPVIEFLRNHRTAEGLHSFDQCQVDRLEDALKGMASKSAIFGQWGNEDTVRELMKHAVFDGGTVWLKECLEPGADGGPNRSNAWITYHMTRISGNVEAGFVGRQLGSSDSSGADSSTPASVVREPVDARTDISQGPEGDLEVAEPPLMGTPRVVEGPPEEIPALRGSRRILGQDDEEGRERGDSQ